MNAITFVFYGSILILFTRSLLLGNISTAAFAAIFGSIDSMFLFFSIVLNRNISTVSNNFGLVRNYYRFCKLDVSHGIAKKMDIDAGIQLRDISFVYPNKEIKALDAINLDIQSGETIAFVGENGSGKSTLVKIIAGLYHPTEGTVTVFGRDCVQESMSNRYESVSAAFQNFQKYKMSLRTNIQISDFNYTEAEPELEELARVAGIDINNRSLTDGYETMLSRDFDGVDLSIGQWQRVAIARGLHRKSTLVFLDEPTASIDPIEECELFRQFINMSKGHTTIIVTHRLGSAKIADRICVLDQGRIVEVGNHDVLIEKNGIYATLYRSQAKWYD